MATAPRQRATREIDYPTTDHKPMAESDLHRRVMIDAIQTLEYHLADSPNVYVSGNILLYYEEGNPRKRVAPDVLVAFEVPKEPNRDYYLLWKEGKVPDVVIEITSKKTMREDKKKKWELYRDVLKVPEYFQFDPRAEYLKPPLQGFRLVEREYIPIQSVAGRLPSEILGLHLERDGTELRLYNPATGHRLLTIDERIEEEKRLTAEYRQQREAAEAERQRLAEETDRLCQEIEALRRRSNSE